MKRLPSIPEDDEWFPRLTVNGRDLSDSKKAESPRVTVDMAAYEQMLSKSEKEDDDNGPLSLFP